MKKEKFFAFALALTNLVYLEAFSPPFTRPTKRAVQAM